MRRLVAVLAGVGLLLSGCGDDGGERPAPKSRVRAVTEGPNSWDRFYVVQVDGRDCVVFDGDRAGGISCDWSDR